APWAGAWPPWPLSAWTGVGSGGGVGSWARTAAPIQTAAITAGKTQRHRPPVQNPRGIATSILLATRRDPSIRRRGGPRCPARRRADGDPAGSGFYRPGSNPSARVRRSGQIGPKSVRQPCLRPPEPARVRQDCPTYTAGSDGVRPHGPTDTGGVGA